MDCTYQATNNAEDTVQEQTDGGENLEQRLGEQTPERAKLLLRMRHVLEFTLSAVDALGNGASELW